MIKMFTNDIFCMNLLIKKYIVVMYLFTFHIVMVFVISGTVVPVMNGHPRDQAKVSVHCRWPLIRGNLTLKCVGRGIDNVAVQGRWPLTTGVAQGRYYCNPFAHFLSTMDMFVLNV